MKNLSKNKIKFIVDNFFERGDINLKFFEKLKSKEELHFLAEIYNWDYDITVLRKIIQSPYCDKGTALMLFWRACPEDILEFSNETKADYESDSYNLLQEIIEKYAKDEFKTNQISYDPREDNHNDVLNRKPKNINEIFYKKTLGEKFPTYQWQIEEGINRTLITQEDANGLVKIKTIFRHIYIDQQENLEYVDKVVCLNEKEVEKEILFPKELWDKKYQYTADTNSWTANYIILTNEKGEVKSVFLVSADNKLIIDEQNIANLKFKFTEEIPNITMCELKVEVTYTVNRP